MYHSNIHTKIVFLYIFYQLKHIPSKALVAQWVHLFRLVIYVKYEILGLSINHLLLIGNSFRYSCICSGYFQMINPCSKLTYRMIKSEITLSGPEIQPRDPRTPERSRDTLLLKRL